MATNSPSTSASVKPRFWIFSVWSRQKVGKRLISFYLISFHFLGYFKNVFCVCLHCLHGAKQMRDTNKMHCDCKCCLSRLHIVFHRNSNVEDPSGTWIGHAMFEHRVCELLLVLTQGV